MTQTLPRLTTVLTSPKAAAIISSLLIAPFMVMEQVNRAGSDDGYPVLLFAVLWLGAFVSLLALRTILLLRGRKDRAAPGYQVLASAVLLLTVFVWIALITDQMPCFRGVPNCD